MRLHQALLPGFIDSHSHFVLVALKLADLVIIDRNPLEVDPDDLRNLKVIETIKEGQVVYQRQE